MDGGTDFSDEVEETVDFRGSQRCLLVFGLQNKCWKGKFNEQNLPPHPLIENGPYFDRNMTDLLKGVALIFMFVHHLFTFPSWYIDSISYPELEAFAHIFCMPFKICVGIFAFLTGYTYAFQRNKSLRYSFRKILLFLSAYWVSYAVLLGFCAILGQPLPGLKAFVCELFALKRPIMSFCWYVSFYCLAMLILPLIAPAIEWNLLSGIALGVFAPVFIRGILPKIHILGEAIGSIPEWFPCVAIGWIFAQYHVFEQLFDRLFKEKIKFQWQNFILQAGIAFAAFLGRYVMPAFSFGSVSTPWGDQNLSLNLDVVYVPFFVYAMVTILSMIAKCQVGRFLLELLKKIGQKSMLMWFLHCVLLNNCRRFFQRVIYFPHNPVLVILWALIFFYAMACIVNIPVEYLTAWEKKQLNRMQ